MWSDYCKLLLFTWQSSPIIHNKKQNRPQTLDFTFLNSSINIIIIFILIFNYLFFPKYIFPFSIRMQYKEAISIQLGRCNDQYTDTLYEPLRWFLAHQTTQKSEDLRKAAQQSNIISYPYVHNQQQRRQIGKNILIPKTIKLKRAQDLSKIVVPNGVVYHTLGVSEKVLQPISQLELQSKLKTRPTEQLIAYEYGSECTSKRSQNQNPLMVNEPTSQLSNKLSLSNVNLKSLIIQPQSEPKQVKFPLCNLPTKISQQNIKIEQSQAFKENKSKDNFPISLTSPNYNKLFVTEKNKHLFPISLASLVSGDNMPDAITCKAPQNQNKKQYLEGIFTTRASVNSPVSAGQNVQNKTTNLVFQSQEQTKNSSVQFFSTNQKKLYDQISQSPSAKRSWYNLLSKFQDMSEDRISQISSILQNTSVYEKTDGNNNNASKTQKININAKETDEKDNYNRTKYKYNLFSILDATTNNLIQQIPGAGDNMLVCGQIQCIASKPKRNNWGTSQTSIKTIMGQIQKQYDMIENKILEEMQAFQESQDTSERDEQKNGSTQEIDFTCQKMNINC